MGGASNLPHDTLFHMTAATALTREPYNGSADRLLTGRRPPPRAHGGRRSTPGRVSSRDGLATRQGPPSQRPAQRRRRTRCELRARTDRSLTGRSATREQNHCRRGGWMARRDSISVAARGTRTAKGGWIELDRRHVPIPRSAHLHGPLTRLPEVRDGPAVSWPDTVAAGRVGAASRTPGFLLGWTRARPCWTAAMLRVEMQYPRTHERWPGVDGQTSSIAMRTSYRDAGPDATDAEGRRARGDDRWRAEKERNRRAARAVR